MRWNVSSDVPLASMVMTKKREEAICAPWADSKGALRCALVLRAAPRHAELCCVVSCRVVL